MNERPKLTSEEKQALARAKSEEAAQAMHEYREAERVVDANTARLRAARLEKEAADEVVAKAAAAAKRAAKAAVKPRAKRAKLGPA